MKDKIIKAVKNFFSKFKKKEKEITIRDKAVKALCIAVGEYSQWYDEHGLYLPPDYATNPSEWNEVMHKIKRAFRLLYDEMNKEGDLWEVKNKWEKYGQKDVEEIEALEKEIRDGFILFGSQLLYMNDIKKDD